MSLAGAGNEGDIVTVATENPLRRPADQVLPITVQLEQGDTDLPGCWQLPETEYRDTYYTNPKYPLSVATLPNTGEEYEYGCSTVARQNARMSRRRGYQYQRIDRADWQDDLYALRSSAPFRQGREMPDAYMQPQAYPTDRWPDPHCLRHLRTVHGVVGPDGHLAGYTQIVQCGEIARVNTILGHADKLDDRVMWLLMLETIRWHIDECHARYFLYYTHLSGHGPGLRYWKERFGFRPVTVTWEF